MTPEQSRRVAQLLLIDAAYVSAAADYHEKAARELRKEEGEFIALASNLNAQADIDIIAKSRER
jgi:hypothetical protein